MTRPPADLRTMQRALADVVRGASSPAELGAAIAPGSARLTPAMQLAIYREQFVLRHVRALREDFLSLENALGEARFESLAAAYVQQFPPSSFTLRDLGASLVRFVEEALPWSDDPLLADLARVEWAFVEAFDAPDGPALTLESLSSLAEDDWPSVRLVLQPSVQRLALAYPAHDQRLAARAAGAGAPPVPRAEPRTSHVVVFRGKQRLECLDVEAVAYALLDELARGAPLGEACERVFALSRAPEGAFGAKVGAWFQQWTALGWLGRVERG